jgi:hypothetical protein
MISISLDDPEFFQKIYAANPDKFDQEQMAKNIAEERANNGQPPDPQDQELEEILASIAGYIYDYTNSGESSRDEAVYSVTKLYKHRLKKLIIRARIDSLLDLETWVKLHDLDTEMILDGIKHMIKSNLLLPDQLRLDNSERINKLKKELEGKNE